MRIAQTIRRRWRLSLHIPFIVCLVILVAVVLAIAVRLPNKASPAQHTVQTLSQETIATTPTERVSYLLQDIHTAASPAAKADAYYSLAVAYLDTRQPNQAIKAFQDASAADKSYTLKSLDSTANAYTMLGDRQHTIVTIQSIIAYLSASSDPSLLGQVSWYQYKLQVLQQGGGL